MEFVCHNGVWKKGGKPVKTFPLQKEKEAPWEIAEEAYREYAAQYGTDQSLERLAERGGFGGAEMAILLVQRIRRIMQQNATDKEKIEFMKNQVLDLSIANGKLKKELEKAK